MLQCINGSVWTNRDELGWGKIANASVKWLVNHVALKLFMKCYKTGKPTAAPIRKINFLLQNT